MSWESAYAWVLGLGEKHSVDPIIFGLVYVIAITISWVSVIWLIRNVRTKRPVYCPVGAIAFFHAVPYLYIVIAGRHISWWAYASIGVLIVFVLGGVIIKVCQILRSKPE